MWQYSPFRSTHPLSVRLVTGGHWPVSPCFYSDVKGGGRNLLRGCVLLHREFAPLQRSSCLSRRRQLFRLGGAVGETWSNHPQDLVSFPTDLTKMKITILAIIMRDTTEAFWHHHNHQHQHQLLPGGLGRCSPAQGAFDWWGNPWQCQCTTSGVIIMIMIIIINHHCHHHDQSLPSSSSWPSKIFNAICKTKPTNIFQEIPAAFQMSSQDFKAK